MKKIIQHPQEYLELAEIFDVMNDCHQFHYSASLQERALAQCENPGLIDVVMHRMGLQVRVPTQLMRQVLFATVEELFAPVMLGDFLMEYWAKYILKIGNPQDVLSSKEYFLIREFFIYFLKFKGLEGDCCLFEFESPLKGGEIRCT